MWIDNADVGARLQVEDNDEVGGACFEEDSAQTAGQIWSNSSGLIVIFEGTVLAAVVIKNKQNKQAGQ